MACTVFESSLFLFVLMWLPIFGKTQCDVLSYTPDDIDVLEHTRAWFNWTHTCPDVDISWVYRDSSGNTPDMLSYINGTVKSYTTPRARRAGYDEFKGSAHLYLDNVSASDEGEYEVSIAPTNAGGNPAKDAVNLRVIRESDIHLTVTIDGIPCQLSVANNGTDIILPDSDVVYTTHPNISVQVAEFVPTPLSIVFYNRVQNTRYTDLGIKNSNKCDKCRNCTFSWYNELVVDVKFSIQNLEGIRIRKTINTQDPWKLTPGHIFVMANTMAVFSWAHRLQYPLNIRWYYKRDIEDPESSYILGHIDGRLDIPTDADRHNRLEYDPVPGSAIMKLERVKTEDEGVYEVKLEQDREGNTAKYHADSSARLTVIERSGLTCAVILNGERYDWSVDKNGTALTLPDEKVSRSLSGYMVNVIITESATMPSASMIMLIMQDSGDKRTYHNITCHDTNRCERKFQFCSDTFNLDEVNVHIHIQFGIQNLEVVSIKRTVKRGARLSWKGVVGIVFAGLFAISVIGNGVQAKECISKYLRVCWRQLHIHAGDATPDEKTPIDDFGTPFVTTDELQGHPLKLNCLSCVNLDRPFVTDVKPCSNEELLDIADRMINGKGGFVYFRQRDGTDSITHEQNKDLETTFKTYIGSKREITPPDCDNSISVSLSNDVLQMVIKPVSPMRSDSYPARKEFGPSVAGERRPVIEMDKATKTPQMNGDEACGTSNVDSGLAAVEAISETGGSRLPSFGSLSFQSSSTISNELI